MPINFAEMSAGRVVIFDGGMGTMLSARGLPDGKLCEDANITLPSLVTGVHRDYLAAGADIIVTNTFQASEFKVEDVEGVVAAAVGCARKAGAKYVGLDIGPTGKMLAPIGELGFERAVGVFSRIAGAGEAAGVDFILIETFASIHEAKAAVLAVRETAHLPVVCTMTFEENGRSFMGCTPATAAITLEGLGVAAIGLNCSSGPVQLLPIVREMLNYTRLPLLVQPNAGLPVMRDGRPTYDLTPDEFAEKLGEMADLGVAMVGGCCGTTPEHIRALAARLALKPRVTPTPPDFTACTGSQEALIFDGSPIKLSGQLSADTTDPEEIIDLAIDMAEDDDIKLIHLSGEHPDNLVRAVLGIQSVVGLPLLIESKNPEALDCALRVYAGRAAVAKNPSGGDGIAASLSKYGGIELSKTADGWVV